MPNKPNIIGAIILAPIFASIAACSSNYTKYETGDFWCNERYLKVENKPFGFKHLEVAKRGYIYSLASSLVLQKENNEGFSHSYKAPARLVLVEKLDRHYSGFEASTFKLYSPDDLTNLKEIIIAFTGSNDSADWITTNLFFSQSQYRLARQYVISIAQRFPGKRLVVTGTSLGGGLAVHVTKHKDTSSLVSETWAFNPSPKNYVNDDIDDRIWLASTNGEALKTMRSPWMRWWPGVSNIGSPESQTAENYYLISSNLAYAHFRWVITRNMLFAADLAVLKEKECKAAAECSSVLTEPLEILKKSHFEACRNPKLSTE